MFDYNKFETDIVTAMKDTLTKWAGEYFDAEERAKFFATVNSKEAVIRGKYMKKLIVLRGNSGSGKTTVTKELQKRFGNNTMLI